MRSFGAWWWSLVAAGLLAASAPCAAQGEAPPARPLALTPEERAFLAQRAPLTVATKVEWAPIDAYTYEGQYRGLSGEVLHLVSQRLGVPLRTVAMPTLAAGLDALRSGFVDIVPSVAETPQRAAYMRFSKTYLDVPNVYVARRGVGPVGDGHTLEGLRVAAERGYAVIGLVRERHPLARVVEFDDTMAALRAVSEGQAEVYLGALPTTSFMVEKLMLSNLEIRGPWRSELSRLHFGLRRDDALLQQLVDRALDSITEAERHAIHRRWVPLRSLLAEPAPPLPMNEAERRFVAAMRPLRVGYDVTHFPYTFRDSAGRAAGMGFDLLSSIARRTGVPLGPSEGGAWSEVYAKARSGEVDLLVAVSANEERRRDFHFIGPWIGTPAVLVTRPGAELPGLLADLRGKTVAVLRDGQHEFQMKRLHPEVKRLPLADRDELLAAVANGRADAALSNVSFVVPRLQTGAAAGLKLAGVLPEMNTDLYLAVRREQGELAALLSRALESMDEMDHAAIASRWAVLDGLPGPSTAEVLRRAAPWLGALAAALAISLVWAFFLRREVRATRRAEAALAAERDRAEALARARGDFVVVASHEIRTPVNAVIGALELMARDGVGAPPPALGLARRAAAQLLEFVNNLLDLTKADAGRLAIHPEDEDVAAAVKDTAATLAHLAEHRGLTLEAQVDPRIALRLKADPMRLRQIVMNLLSNAIKFTPRGGRVLLRLDLVDEDAAAQRLALVVEDNGVGIAAEHQAGLFRPFEQVHAAGSSRAPGSGLGLVLVKRLVDAMGGTIDLASAPGEGARFTVTLALPRGATPDAAATRASLRRVLVVDDDPVQQIVLGEELRALGCQVDVAGDAPEALALWRQHRHGMVFTDCRMPGQSGLDLARALRAEPGSAALRIVGTSADVDDSESALAAGMQRLLPKPVPRALLRDVLAQG